MCRTVTPSGEAAQTPASTIRKQGLGREAWAALLRVSTRPECPKGNLIELTWDSKPDHGTATWWKALNWDTARPGHRTKDWAELAGYGPAHPPGDRQARAPRDRKGQSQPQRSIIYQTASRLHCQPRLLGILDSRHPPEKVCQLYTQKTERQGQGRW